MARKSKLKKYQLEKFDYYQTINEYYMNDGRAYISVNISSIDDIISKYSVKNDEILNPEFMHYIETNASYIPDEYPLTLEICNHKFSDKEKEIIKKVIKNHYAIGLFNKKNELKISKRRCKLLFFSGLGILLVYSFMIYIPFFNILREIFSLLFCFSMWETADVMIFHHDEINEKIIDLQNLSEIEIIFREG